MANLRLEGQRMLAVDLVGDSVRALNGSMVAAVGDFSYKKQSFGGEGMLRGLKRKVQGEGLSLMEVTGHGTVYFANLANEILLVPVQGELFAEASAVLALDGQLQTDVVFSGVRGLSAGTGLWTSKFSGQGLAALVSDGPPILLAVTPQMPVTVDPDAYIGHTGQLQQTFNPGISWRNAVGGDHGEAFSMVFSGQGLVYIQPAER